MRNGILCLLLISLVGAASRTTYAVGYLPLDRDLRIDRSIAIDGGNVVAGSRDLDSDPNDNTANDGLAAIYDATTGARMHTLRADDRVNSAQFGASVDLDNGIAIVGAPRRSVLHAGFQGVAYLFDATTGEQLQRLTTSEVTDNARFGDAVAIDGNLAIVGAPWSNAFTGAAFVFDATSGQQLARLHFDGPPSASNNYFGASVAMAGNYAVIGATGASGWFGSATVFDLTTRSPVMTLVAPQELGGNQFGASVAINDKYIVVGAPNFYGDAGAAYVYDAQSGALLREFALDDDGIGDSFGQSVALSGDTVLVSASHRAVDGIAAAGQLYLYDLNSGALVRSIREATPTHGESHGFDMDGDGNSIAVIGQSHGGVYRIPEPSSGMVLTIGACGATGTFSRLHRHQHQTRE